MATIKRLSRNFTNYPTNFNETWMIIIGNRRYLYKNTLPENCDISISKYFQ